MKIKSIATICKKNKQVVLFNRYSDSGTISQYIGDGSAVYPISGLPELDEESILTIFDVPEKQCEDWLVRYRDIPEGISFEDTDATEKIIEQGNLSIVYSGKTLKPLQTRRGLVFIESRYLSPVSDVLDVLELYERVTPFGAPYIVAKAGFLLQAVIMPCDVISAHCGSRPYNPENPDAPCSAQSKKPEGVAVELADCVIRILDYCGHAGIDIEEAIRIKHEYNKTRPYRHGGKKC